MDGIQCKKRIAVQKEALGSGDTSHQWNNRDRGGRPRCNQSKLEWVLELNSHSGQSCTGLKGNLWRQPVPASQFTVTPTASWERGQQLGQYLISPQLQPKWTLNANGVAQATHQHTLRSMTPPHLPTLEVCWPFLIVPQLYRQSRKLELDALFIVVMPSLGWRPTHNEAREENKRHDVWKGKQKNCVCNDMMAPLEKSQKYKNKITRISEFQCHRETYQYT